IRGVTPAGCPECPGVQPGSFRGKLASLQQEHLAAVLGEVAGGGGTCDSAADDEDVGLVHMALLCMCRTQCINLQQKQTMDRTEWFPHPLAGICQQDHIEI